MSKLYDAKVVTGEYQDRQTGENKKRYADVGVILNGEYGPYMIMNRSFNPAGVPCDPNKSSIIVKLFKAGDEKADPAAGPAGAPVFNPAPKGPTLPAGKFKDDIPF